MSEPELKLVMVPSDGKFIPYTENKSENNPKSPTNGRIFVLKFESGPARHLFWMQSKSQHERGDPSWFSPRDLKIGWIVDRFLQGEQVNTTEELANVVNDNSGNGGDAVMEDALPDGHGDSGGGAGSGEPFTGHPENEGEGSREGGADGGRA